MEYLQIVPKPGTGRRARKRAPHPTFAALDRTRVRSLGILVSVELDRDTHDFAHLVGQRIIIDGRLETCFSVERLGHASPWKVGERINLLIRKAK
jgi:hypothetical protein